MNNASAVLDAHAKPPNKIRDAYKRFQKLDSQKLKDTPDLIDLGYSSVTDHQSIRPVNGDFLPDELQQALSNFLGSSDEGDFNHLSGRRELFEVKTLPGLFIYPSLLPRASQLYLLDKLLHRDMSNPKHNTNVHMHYEVPYPPRHGDNATASYFDPGSSSLAFQPKDRSVHKPFTTQQFLTKKLRWITLGGQYDWTNKIYPSEAPPSFPSDVKELIERIFPMKAEAAIVNLYSPGDTLSLHRDVSEECDQPLVSISLGCDGIFVVGLGSDDAHSSSDDNNAGVAIIRLRSGDAVLMCGKSRYAWHGVPKVLDGTCPPWMRDWPFPSESAAFEDDVEQFRQWKGWMAGKRVNLNVRQMFDGSRGQ